MHRIQRMLSEKSELPADRQIIEREDWAFSEPELLFIPMKIP